MWYFSISAFIWVTGPPIKSDFIGAKDDGGGGDNWSCNTCKAPVKLSASTNRYLVFYRPDDLPVTEIKVSKH